MSSTLKRNSLGQLFRSPSAAASVQSPDFINSNVRIAIRLLKHRHDKLKTVPYLTAVSEISLKILHERKEIITNYHDLCQTIIEKVANISINLVHGFNLLLGVGGEWSTLAGEPLDKERPLVLDEIKQDLYGFGTLLAEIHILFSTLTTVTPRTLLTAIGRDGLRGKLQNYCRRLQEYEKILSATRFLRLVRPLKDKTPGPIHHDCMLPPTSPMFIGREDVLHKLDECFDFSFVSSRRQRVFVLYGPSGSGKTQIVSKFLERASKRFSAVYFLDASTIQSLTSCLQCIGPKAGDSGAKASATLRWLSKQREDWLLIYDNVDLPDTDLRHYFPSCSHGNIIITSSHEETCKYAPPQSHFNVDALKPHEATSLLLISSMCGPGEGYREKAEVIVTELEYLPLAIVQAGSFISELPTTTLEDYLTKYREKLSGLLKRKSLGAADSYPWTVYTTWELSFNRLSPQAASFLQIYAYLHHAHVPKALFVNALKGIGDFSSEEYPDTWRDASKFLETFRTRKGEWNDVAFQRVINELNSFSLLHPVEKDTYYIHPLSHAWSRLRDSSKAHSLCAGHLLALSIRSKPDEEDEGYRKVLLAHLSAWLTACGYSNVDFTMGIRFALTFQEQGWLKQAEALWKLVISAQRALQGDCHPQTLASMSKLASIYRSQGRWEEAEQVFLSVLEMRQIVQGDDHLDTLSSMKDLAAVYHAQERVGAAEELNSSVLERQKKVLGDAHPSTLNTMTNLAVLYGSQGRWNEAQALEVSAIQGQKELGREEHPDTLQSMATLAATYRSQGQWEEAEKLGTEVLEARKKVLGESHPTTVASMADLANTYCKLGRWSEAVNLLEVVVAKQKEQFGVDHSATVQSMFDLRRAREQAYMRSMRGKLQRMSTFWK